MAFDVFGNDIPTLDNCPECSGVLTNHENELICHDCGLREPVVRTTIAKNQWQIDTRFQLVSHKSTGEKLEGLVVEAKIDGQVVGRLIAGKQESGQYVTDYVEVLPQHRRQGVATALILKAHQVCPMIPYHLVENQIYQSEAGRKLIEKMAKTHVAGPALLALPEIAELGAAAAPEIAGAGVAAPELAAGGGGMLGGMGGLPGRALQMMGIRGLMNGVLGTGDQGQQAMQQQQGVPMAGVLGSKHKHFDVDEFMTNFPDETVEEVSHRLFDHYYFLVKKAEDGEELDHDETDILKALDQLLESAHPGYKDHKEGDDDLKEFDEAVEDLPEVTSDENPDAENDPPTKTTHLAGAALLEAAGGGASEVGSASASMGVGGIGAAMRNALGGVDDVAYGLGQGHGGAGGGGGGNSTKPGTLGFFLARVDVNEDEFWWAKSSAGAPPEEEIGWATQNRGDDSNPEIAGSGAAWNEQGDGPELLKDVDNIGGPQAPQSQDMDAFFQQFKHLGEPQDVALALYDKLHPRLEPYQHIGLSEGDPDYQVAQGLDQVMEHAFPGYRGPGNMDEMSAWQNETGKANPEDRDIKRPGFNTSKLADLMDLPSLGDQGTDPTQGAPVDQDYGDWQAPAGPTPCMIEIGEPQREITVDPTTLPVRVPGLPSTPEPIEVPAPASPTEAPTEPEKVPA